MNTEESGTYRHSWVIIVIPKKTEDIQCIIAAELWYVVVAFEPCSR